MHKTNYKDVALVAENTFMAICNAQGRQIEDVRYNADYQTQDIDFIVNPGTDKETTVEVKGDTVMHKTHNLYAENISYHTIAPNNAGWLKFSKAEWLAYYDEHHHILHFMRMQELRDIINTGLHREVPTYSDRGLDGYGYLVSEEEFKALPSYRALALQIEPKTVAEYCILN